MTVICVTGFCIALALFPILIIILTLNPLFFRLKYFSSFEAVNCARNIFNLAVEKSYQRGTTVVIKIRVYYLLWFKVRYDQININYTKDFWQLLICLNLDKIISFTFCWFTVDLVIHVFIREVLIFVNFTRRTNSPIEETCEIYFHNSVTKEKWKFANSNFVKSSKIRNCENLSMRRLPDPQYSDIV